MAVTLKGYTANYLGLSTDAKPTEADDNAIFRELDTGKRYYFTGAAWAEIPSSGGGGGGDVTSVNGKTGAVTLTASDVGAYTTTEADALLADKQNKAMSASVKIGTEVETTVEGAIGEVAAIIPATAATTNKLSTAADTAGEDITATANSDDIALTDSADARVHDLKIYGKTENGHSVGENGLTVTAEQKLLNIGDEVVSRDYWGVMFTITRNEKGEVTEINANGTASQSLWFELIKDNSKIFPKGAYISGCPLGGSLNTYCIGVYHSVASGISEGYAFDVGNGAIVPENTDCQRVSIVIKSGITVNNLKFKPQVNLKSSLNVTTSLPLRGNGDVKDEIDLADGVAITRLDSNGDVLATPVTTPLSDAEKAAFAEFRTFDGNTNVTATDNPFMSMVYVKNTDNGKALADVDNKTAVRMAMIAAPYDDTATYAVGNYCTYGDRLWKCNTAIGTAEPFTAAHWTATTVMEEIS